MAKKKAKRKSAKKAARKVIYRTRVVTAKPKRHKSRKTKKAKKQPRRRIGATKRSSMKGTIKKVLMRSLSGAVVGVSAYGTKRLLGYVPPSVNPWVRDLGTYALGVGVASIHPMTEAVGLGMAGKGVENIFDRVIPGGPVVNGIGRDRRSRLSAAEVRAVEAASRRDRNVNGSAGMRERTVAGQGVAGTRDLV